MTRSASNFHFLIFCFIIIFIIGCGKKAVIEKRVEKPIFVYEVYTHGINPKSVSIKIYRDGYAIVCSEDFYTANEGKLRAEYILENRVDGLISYFLNEGFLNIEPISLPAIYGGEVTTITFNYEGKSNTIKFLNGTKIPFSVEKCWDKLQITVTSLSK